MTICWIAAPVAAFTYSTPLLTICGGGEKKASTLPFSKISLHFFFRLKILLIWQPLNAGGRLHIVNFVCCHIQSGTRRSNVSGAPVQVSLIDLLLGGHSAHDLLTV